MSWSNNKCELQKIYMFDTWKENKLSELQIGSYTARCLTISTTHRPLTAVMHMTWECDVVES
ncbi:hypothetical protein DPMN_149162 [Dreissena polymorpha]|uniref:Uncharacterized protein n=1 Tax=Dreissena polymorpha TaxID=45954 RepID=A0A9D4J521_DREPO|nr:hypothetical protein DPMN_149162 [Dreissena polymorpha]